MAPVPQPEDERDRPGQHPDESEMDNFDYPDVVINADSSGSEDEDVNDDTAYMGYQSLSQNMQDSDSEVDEQEQEDEHFENAPDVEMQAENVPEVHVPEGLLHQMRHCNPSNQPSYMQAPDLPRPSKQELLWNQPASSNLALDGGQMEKIKSVMAGIQLPASSIPDWAKSLSDDQWKSQVVSRLVTKETKHRQEYCVKPSDQSMCRRKCGEMEDEIDSSISVRQGTSSEKERNQAPD